MPGLALFICYRRADASAEARVVYEALRRRYGRDSLFMDVDSILPGGDWVQGIDEAIGRSDVLLAVIGPEWTGASDRDGSLRLFDPRDRVRLELEAAMRRRMPIIPVLVEDAAMPRFDELPESLQPLHRYQSLRLDHQTFDSDFSALLKVLRVHERNKKSAQAAARPAAEGASVPAAVGAAAAAPIETAPPAPEPEARSSPVPPPVAAPRLSGAGQTRTARRGPSSFALYAVAVVLIAVVALGGLYVMGAGPFAGLPAQPSQPPLPTHTTFSDQAGALLGHVPPALWSKCEEHPSEDAAVALLLCQADGGEIYVKYYRYPDGSNLGSRIDEYVQAVGGDIPAGDCSRTDEWPVLDRYVANGADRGDALCAVYQELAHIFWADDRTNILGRAWTYSGDTDRLVAFWRSEAGPLD